MQPSQYSARRTDRLGVHSLDHVALTVPSLDEAARFYSAFGLDIREADNCLDVAAHGNPHVWLRLSQGADKRLRYVSFGAFPDDIELLADRLAAAGVVRVAPPKDADGAGLWMHDPLGTLVEIRAASKITPDGKPDHLTIITPAGGRAAAMRDQLDSVRPTRMSHAVFFTPDVPASARFYQDILGLRISDFLGPAAFLHGPHGSDHHMIAFAQSSAMGYHHSAWEVRSLDEVGLGAAQMRAAGYDQGWGLGRHVLGSNYFHYVRDPWGSYAEYSFDIDYVPAEQDWEAGYPAPENSLYQWGPDVPEDFITNHEASS
jgi:catechol 2,3-dioxygenase